MKLVLSYLCVFFTTGLLAAPVNLVCITENPTTSFVAFTEGETTTVRLIHHNGTQFMPVWSNLITPHDIKTISETAEVLSDLGPMLEFQIPSKACEVDGLLVNCFGRSETQEINGRKIYLWSVNTSMESDKSLLGEFNSTWTNLGIDVDGKTYWLPMKYFENDCFNTLTAKEAKKKAAARNLFLK